MELGLLSKRHRWGTFQKIDGGPRGAGGLGTLRAKGTPLLFAAHLCWCWQQMCRVEGSMRYKTSKIADRCFISKSFSRVTLGLRLWVSSFQALGSCLWCAEMYSILTVGPYLSFSSLPFPHSLSPSSRSFFIFSFFLVLEVAWRPSHWATSPAHFVFCFEKESQMVHFGLEFEFLLSKPLK